MNPVFIVGMPRSGTTLLAGMLNAHPDLAIGPETGFCTQFWRNGICSDALNESKRRAWIDTLVNSDAVKDAKLSDSTMAQLERRFQTHGTTYVATLDIWMQTIATEHGKTRWGEKTPRHIEHVPRLLRWFPNARVVCIVRDPRDVHHSLNRVKWDAESALEHAFRWRAYALTARRLERDPRVAVIRYEDLVTDPERALAAVCQHVALEFDPLMLQPQNAPATFNPAREPWKQNNLNAIDSSRAWQWKHRASGPDRVMIEAVCSRVMTGYGYETNKRRTPLAPSTRAKFAFMRLLWRNRVDKLFFQLRSHLG